MIGVELQVHPGGEGTQIEADSKEIVANRVPGLVLGGCV